MRVLHTRLLLPVMLVSLSACMATTGGVPAERQQTPMAQLPMPDASPLPDPPMADLPMPGAAGPAAEADAPPAAASRGPSSIGSIAGRRTTRPRGMADREAVPAYRSAALDEPNIVAIPFGTTRKPEEDGRGGTLSFGDDEADDLIYGLAEVSVPPARNNVCGKMESWVFRPDPEKHVVFGVAAILPEDDFFARLKAANQEAGRTLVYIHGHSVSFENAARRAASLHQDLTQCFGAPPSVPVVFSWPAKSGFLDSVLSYNANQNRSRRSQRELTDFLLALHERSGAGRIDLIAHSMGASMLVDSLKDLQLARPAGAPPMCGQWVFSAPDVDRDTFADRAADFGPSIGRAGIAQRVTLYASDSDKALLASARVWESDRAGQASPLPPLLVPGIDTVDASAVTTDLFSLNHTGFAEVAALVRDIAALLAADLPPESRGLLPGSMGPASLPYWIVAR
jgi:esterase/lipase superfamily enzyme